MAELILKRGQPYKLVLSGGGVRSLYALGFASTLAERGITYSGVFGTSAGACYAIPLVRGLAQEFVEEAAARARHFKFINPNWHAAGERFFSFQREFAAMIRWRFDFDKIKSGPPIVFNTLKPNGELHRAWWHFCRLAWLSHRDLMDGTSRAASYFERHGIREVVLNTKLMRTQDQMLDALFATASTPLLVKPSPFQEGAMDGGLVFSLPVHLALNHPGEDPILAVSNSRRVCAYTQRFHPNAPSISWWHCDRLPRVSMWGYDDPEGLLALYRKGCDDAARIVITD